MLRFAVYDDCGLAQDWPLVQAHLVGRDEAPVRGSVMFGEGVIEGRRRGSQTKRDAAGLCLMHEVGELGTMMLPTCLLPGREKPYLLSLELARHRIKLFLAKSEDWQMFDLDEEHPAMRLWEEARLLFTKAWTCPDSLQADQWARRSLHRGLEATDRLALAHADILLHRRFARKAASSSTLGVRVWPEREVKPLRPILKKEFDVLTIPLNWRHLEVQEGKYNWEPLDRWMEWAKKEGKPVVAGPLIDFSRRAIPKWMYVWQHDYDTCRDLLYDHLERVVQRYAGAVGMWNLCSGLNLNRNFVFTPEQMLDLTRMALLLVKQTHRGARTMIEIARPFGEHCAGKDGALHPLVFLDRVVQGGIHVDAYGVKLLFGNRHIGMGYRDLMQLSAALDRYFPFEKPILVSALGVPGGTGGAGTSHQEKDDVGNQGATGGGPGVGGGPVNGWNEEQQAKWLARMFAICLSKPFVESVFWGDLYDHANSELPGGGLVNERGQARMALQKIISLRRQFRKPLGDRKQPTPGSPNPAPATPASD